MMNLENMIRGMASDTVAKNLIRLWEHDEGTLKFWRASSNFVYAFERDTVPNYLRFVFEKDNSISQIRAELEFMHYLQQNGYPCVTSVRSLNGELIESFTTTDGTYFAVVFSAATGTNLDAETITEEQMKDWGKSLASLHRLSKNFEPASERRKSWLDTIEYMENVFAQFPHEQEALEELGEVTAWLHSMPTTKNVYGLIHYDFELDNVFYDVNNDCRFNVIDFDDAMYHWYVLDIVKALDDFRNTDDPQTAALSQSFLDGYRSITALGEGEMRHIPMYQRFENLYKLSRLLRSLDYQDLKDTPSWFDSLEAKLLLIAERVRRGFIKTC